MEWKKIFPKYTNCSYRSIKKNNNNKQLSQTMGRKPKQSFLQRRHTDDQQAHEEILSVANYQRNANQNYSEVSPHPSQNGHLQNDKCWRGCGDKENRTVGRNVN